MNELTINDYRHINNLKEILKKKFGTLIYQIYCYGSRITEHKEDADFDILIITSTKIDWREQEQIFDAIFDYGIENEILFDKKFMSKEEFEESLSEVPFVKNVKSYGFAVL